MNVFPDELLLQVKLEENPELVTPVQLTVIDDGSTITITLVTADKECFGLNDIANVVAALTSVLPSVAERDETAPAVGVYVTPDVT